MPRSVEYPTRIPPGHVAVRSLPIVHVDNIPKIDFSSWNLRCIGDIEAQRTIRWAEFREIPHVQRLADFHSVIGFSRLDNRWQGVLLRDLLRTLRPNPTATFIRFSDGRVYDTTIPIEVAYRDDVLLADSLDGQLLTADHGAPVRAIVPTKFAWKSVKWLRIIEFLTKDRIGYWESRGYPPPAEPWA